MSINNAGSPLVTSQSGASGPSTMAAVAAALASTQLAAATDAVRHRGAGFSPVRGSTMWCAHHADVRHRRTVVDEVARPPQVIDTV